MSAFDITNYGTRYDGNITTKYLRLVNTTPSDDADSQLAVIDFFGAESNQNHATAQRNAAIEVSRHSINGDTQMKFVLRDTRGSTTTVITSTIDNVRFGVPISADNIDTLNELILSQNGIAAMIIGEDVRVVSDLNLSSPAPQIKASNDITIAIDGATIATITSAALRLGSGVSIESANKWYIRKNNIALMSFDEPEIVVEPGVGNFKVATRFTVVNSQNATIFSVQADSRIGTNLTPLRLLGTDDDGCLTTVNALANIAINNSVFQGAIDVYGTLGFNPGNVKIFATGGTQSGRLRIGAGINALDAYTDGNSKPIFYELAAFPSDDGEHRFYVSPATGTQLIADSTSLSSLLRVVIDKNGLMPGTNNMYDIGGINNRWRNIYSVDIDVQNLKVGLNSNKPLILENIASGNTEIEFRNNLATRAIRLTGSNFVINTSINPTENNMFDLGADTLRWANVFSTNMRTTNMVIDNNIRASTTAGSAASPSYAFSGAFGNSSGMYLVSFGTPELSFSVASGRRAFLSQNTFALFVPLSSAGSLGQSTLRADSQTLATPLRLLNNTTPVSEEMSVFLALQCGTGADPSARIGANGLGHIVLSPAPAGALTNRIVIPNDDNVTFLGTPSNRWANVYIGTGSINTSDVNEKNTIEHAPLGLSFVNQLTPRRFKFNDGTSNRFHYGLIAQEVRQVLDINGITTQDFAAYIEHNITKQVIDEDGNESTTSRMAFGLRYSEFIAPLIKAVQELSAKCNDLQAQIDALQAAL